MSDYRPINCEFHDRLEDAAVRGHAVEVRFLKDGAEATVTSVVRNVRTEQDAEWLDLEGHNPIRLDHVLTFDGEPLPDAC